jgi:hypothetical protein
MQLVSCQPCLTDITTRESIARMPTLNHNWMAWLQARVGVNQHSQDYWPLAMHELSCLFMFSNSSCNFNMARRSMCASPFSQTSAKHAVPIRQARARYGVAKRQQVINK